MERLAQRLIGTVFRRRLAIVNMIERSDNFR